MKTAIYIEDGEAQIVLTPESKFESSVVSQITTSPKSVRIFSGSFYQCQGGYFRHSGSDKSIMIRLDDENTGEEL